MMLAEAIGRGTDMDFLASTLSAVAGRMDAKEAARICGPVAQALAAALDRGARGSPCLSLAAGLSELAGRIGPAEAVEVCAHAAQTMASTLENQDDQSPARVIGCMVYNNNSPSERPARAMAFLWLAGYLERAKVNQLCRGAIRTLLTRLKAPDDSMVLLLSQLDPPTARELAREFALEECSKNSLDPSGLAVILNDCRYTPSDLSLIGSRNALSDSLPCRLSSQDLVELLKMPTCFGMARRVVLQHLGNRYRRHFANHWSFVRYAEETGLKLDFTTPPKRPDPKESVKRMLEILDRTDAK